MKKQLTFDTATANIRLEPSKLAQPPDVTCDGFAAWTEFSKQQQVTRESGNSEVQIQTGRAPLLSTVPKV